MSQEQPDNLGANTAHDILYRIVPGGVPPRDLSFEAKMRNLLSNLTKPLGSLGDLEDIAIRLSGIQSSTTIRLKHRQVLVFAGDHGIARRGVSAYPQEVTRQMLRNFASGGAAINILAKLAKAELVVVDVGVEGDLFVANNVQSSRVKGCTNDFLQSAAMTQEEVIAAICVGADAVNCKSQLSEVDVIAIGEMGIANTTSASALTAILLEKNAQEVTGPGTGVSGNVFDRKINIVQQAVSRYGDLSADPLEVLRCCGGFEIAAMVGTILVAAANRIPVVVDGFIATAAAMITAMLEPRTIDYMFSGHCSSEPGHQLQLDFLGLKPILNLQMRLGEATGACLALIILEAACKLSEEMNTFNAACVSRAKIEKKV